MYGDPVGARWSLWKSTDAGATWDSTGLYVPQAGTEAGWNNAMWLNGNNLWYGTNNTRVYYSTNFGSSWQFGATTGSANTYSVTLTTRWHTGCHRPDNRSYVNRRRSKLGNRQHCREQEHDYSFSND